MVISAMTERKARMWMGSVTGLHFKQSSHKRGHLCKSESGKRARTGLRWECGRSKEASMTKSGVGVESASMKSDIRDGPRRPVGRTLTFL